MESSKFKVQSPKKKIIFAVCCFLSVSLMGCATLKETAKGIMGVSTKVLEEGRKDAIIKIFSCNSDTCYDRVKEMLNCTGSHIYARDTKKQMLAIYVAKTDTTPVGIFFERLDANNTRIEVSSPSTYAKELITKRILRIFEPEQKQE